MASVTGEWNVPWASQQVGGAVIPSPLLGLFDVGIRCAGRSYIVGERVASVGP